MRFGRQVLAGCLLVASFTVFPLQQASAYGQHWRPVPGTAPLAHNGAGFSVPNFRPVMAARDYRTPPYPTGGLNNQARHRPAPRFVRQQPVPPMTASRYRPVNPVMAAPRWRQPLQSVPRRNAASSYYPPNTYRPWVGTPQRMQRRAANGARPVNRFVQNRQRDIPLFARQFGWRPAYQPWVRGNATPRRPVAAPRYAMQPGSANFRPAAGPRGVGRPMPGPGMRAAGQYRGWPMQGRVNNPWYPVPRVAQRMPAYAPAAPVYGNRGVVPYGRPMMPRYYGQPVAQMHRYGAPPGQYWRPVSGQRVVMQPSQYTFRPQHYGRSVSPSSLVSDSTARGYEQRQGGDYRFPGWLTTQEDSDFTSQQCAWCNGS